MFESLILQLPMGTEWIWIIVIIGVLFFGAKKIPELARTLGKSKGEFEKGKIEDTNVFLANIVYYVIMVFVILIVLEILGVDQVLTPL